MTWAQYGANGRVECASCRWAGDAKKAKLRMPDETVSEVECPECGETIALMNNVLSPAEIKQQAAEGDPWSKKILENNKNINKTLLKSAAELPDVEGDAELHFIWDAEGTEVAGVTTVIRLKGEGVVWKERAWFGGEKRFEKMRKLLAKKYGPRFQSLEVNFDNPVCGIYYYGD